MNIPVISPADKSLAAPVELPPFPEVYAVTPRGVCMEPLYLDGQPIIVSSTAKVDAGDVVVVHLLPQFVQPGGFEAYVKRLRYGLYGMTFPWDPTGSDVIIPICLEQLNPPGQLDIPVDRIRAVHKVLGRGFIQPDGTVVAHRSIMEDGA